MWNAEKVLDDAERDLVCESMLGMVQPGSRAGIGFGRDLEKRWDLERGIRLLSNVWGRIFRKKEKLVMVSGTSKWMD